MSDELDDDIDEMDDDILLDDECETCSGSGDCQDCDGDDPDCENCDGSGECPDCNGTGIDDE